MNNTRADVAVFIDFENIYVSVREKFDATPNFEALMERCEDYGRVVVARAYADWYRYPRITSALFANNIEPMYVPTYYYDKDEGRQGRPIKNSVDMHMCIDAMRTLYTRTNISKYVFITGDRDFIALVNCVRQEGKEVIIVGIGGAASSHLAQSADEFLFYEQIVAIRPMIQMNRRGERPERPEQRVERPHRLERIERPERLDRNDRNGSGREERRRDRFERPERAERAERLEAPIIERPERLEPPISDRPERVETPQPAPITPIVAIPGLTIAPTGDGTVYDTLVEALQLARKRGYVSSFGSLKVLMKELMPNFKESRYRDTQGRPFTKFTDFVREAERLGKIQIFTSGTVNEVFLPGEDPYKLSQFADDLPSVEAERELEEELALEAAQAEAEIETPEALEAANGNDRNERGSRRRRRRPATTPTNEPEIGEPLLVETVSDIDGEDDTSEEMPVFGDREWGLFFRVMQAYSEPVPFADIFNALRELRNSEELNLTNNALKELIKQAINEHKLQRSNRGAKAHYRLIQEAQERREAALFDEQAADELELPQLDEDELPDLDDEEMLNARAQGTQSKSLSVQKQAEPLPSNDSMPVVPNGQAIIDALPIPQPAEPKKTSRTRKKKDEEPAPPAEPKKTSRARKKKDEELAPPAEPKKTSRARKKKDEELAPPAEPKKTSRRRKVSNPPANLSDTNTTPEVTE